MKKGMLLLLTLLIVSLWTTNAAACWLIFYKPGYKGRIIDAETKAPIKDAVVVAVYHSNVFGWPGGSNTSVINTRETLTDEKGEFYIYPYITLINPFSFQDKTSFIIYKPGYQSYPTCLIYPIHYFSPFPEEFFTKDIGEKGETCFGGKTYQIEFGIVELEKMVTREDRIDTIPPRPTGIGAEDLPILYKTINDENKNLGRRIVDK